MENTVREIECKQCGKTAQRMDSDFCSTKCEKKYERGGGMNIRSYTKILSLGHHGLQSLFKGCVVVQEKIDGSQFSFGVVDGVLEIRSRKCKIDVDVPPKMFEDAVKHVKLLTAFGKLEPGWIYRGEVMSKPKHNTLAYDRIPANNIMLFDVDKGDQAYVLPEELASIANSLSLEAVPLLFDGEVKSESAADFALGLMERVSVLGGPKIEGVVIKNYEVFGRDGKTLMGKYVSEAFKEKHVKDWKTREPSKGDVLDKLCEELTTEARWQKAVQHMAESGKLLGEPKDIGPLLKEIVSDVFEEEGDHIRDVLFKFAKKRIGRAVTHGFPEWYKKKLLESQPCGDTVVEEGVEDV
jgi:hypothetical protein